MLEQTVFCDLCRGEISSYDYIIRKYSPDTKRCFGLFSQKEPAKELDICKKCIQKIVEDI